jgi:ribosomal protein S18 acetylase RimI-like enzyme
MSVEIREVTTHRELKTFITFPFRLYKGNQCWVPPLLMDEFTTLDPKKNPAYKHCDVKLMLAYRDGKPVGRVAAIVNQKYIEKWKNRYCRFGWLDFEDDPEVSSALMGAVEEFARSHDLEAVHGPLGFTDLDREGMLIEGFSELGTMDTYYNHPYYPKHMEALGYGKDVDWVEFEVMVPKEVPEKVLRVQEIVLKRSKVRLVSGPKKIYRKYARGLFDVVNEMYKDLYGVVELTQEQMQAYTDQYFGFLNPDFVRIFVDDNDKVVGFGLTIPSLSRALQRARGRLFPFGFIHLLHALRHPKQIDFLLVAVLPEYQPKGLVAILMNEITVNAIKYGVVSAETNPELETNREVQAMWKHFESRQHKRRRAFIKKLA